MCKPLLNRVASGMCLAELWGTLSGAPHDTPVLRSLDRLPGANFVTVSPLARGPACVNRLGSRKYWQPSFTLRLVGAFNTLSGLAMIR